MWTVENIPNVDLGVKCNFFLQRVGAKGQPIG